MSPTTINGLREDLKSAMKQRDELRLRTLRSIIAEVQQAEGSLPAGQTLDDQAVIKIIAAQVKRRTEAAEAFEAGGAADRAAEERAEQAVLEEYLPARLSDDELDQLVTNALQEGGWTSKADMGSAMKAISAQVAGRADGKLVADLVKQKLGT